MALLPIVQYPDPRLAEKAQPVTEFNDELKQLAADMAETMYAAPGVGLAAPQIGKLIRMMVVDISEDKNDLRVFVNPVIEPLSDEVVDCEEGCLSLPGVYEKVERPARVLIKAQDLDGKPFEMECDELMSVCVQHETDHLNGIVFVDHLSRLKKSRTIAKLANCGVRKPAKPRKKDSNASGDNRYKSAPVAGVRFLLGGKVRSRSVTVGRDSTGNLIDMSMGQVVPHAFNA